MAIHHNTIARAERYGLEIREEGTDFVVYKGGKVLLKGPTARDALQDAIDNLGFIAGGQGDDRHDVAAAATKKAARKSAKPARAAKTERRQAKERPKREGQAATGSIVKDKYRAKYGDDDSCGDDLAAAFGAYVRGDSKNIDVTRLAAVGKENGIDVADRWPSLNHGQVSMNLRNVLRGRLRRGEPVTIGGKKVR